MSIILETSIGDITVDLYLKERPRCCLNFLKLCKIKYYNYHLFHTVQQNFVAQTGDPTGTGRGGDSIFSQLYGQQARLFEAETKPRIKHTKRGSLSMVNDGNHMHGSQFFITLTDNADFLDKQNHTVFGEVAEGFDILDKLNNTITDDKGRPLKDVRIYHTVILDDPIPDPAGLKELIPATSPERNTQEQLEPRIGADEVTDDEKDLKPEEIEERNKERDAKTNAQLLEMVGDIPEADVKPPDNVLFVCKLNPVTGDDDLDSIFSRFGRILSCEVIRDRKTNESLQYAFIEFERAEDCEKAYFKMDNVLIDDRRIHVDFSQSVSKIKWNRTKETVEKEETKPQYRIKDFEKRNDGYEYVFDEPASERKPEKKKRKKEQSPSRSNKTSKKKHVRKRSPSSSSSEDEPPLKQSKKRLSSQSSDDYSLQKKLKFVKSERHKGEDSRRKDEDGHRKGDGGHRKGDNDGYPKGDDGFRKGDDYRQRNDYLRSGNRHRDEDHYRGNYKKEQTHKSRHR